MLINEITNRPEFHLNVTNELKENYGINYRRDKKQKITQDKRHGKIFGVSLNQLELVDVILANGSIVQVPVFVSDACQRILEQVKTEGLFRKAGSTNRQRQIRANLDAGIRLGKTHHVIDVANILKYFFRELPEPILPPGNLQESILLCLLLGERKCEALLTTCLLLSTATLNTLAFFMQFLNTVSMHSHLNKMTIENLAIVFAPGLMPTTQMIGQRLTHHVKVIQLLIENAFNIGIVPKSILNRSQAQQQLIVAQQKPPPETEKKKKKRRSGSLTRMFNGLRKIVLGSSSESLDKNTEIPSSPPMADGREQQITTPCISKSARKRRVLEVNAFSVKRKKEVISMLPDNGAILPSTPQIVKDTKKSRLSLGGKRLGKQSNFTSSIVIPPMERRWSVVGAGWTKKKNRQSTDCLNNPMQMRPLSPVISLPCLQTPPSQMNRSDKGKDAILNSAATTEQTQQPLNASDDDGFVRISKSEYEAIKERVSAIETRLSQEFNNVQASIEHENDLEDVPMNGPEKVLDKYERTLEDTENLVNTSTDQLAKRLSRELKIRRSEEHKVIRSPSARKIGSMRRRSRENVRLSRNFSWHLGSKNNLTDIETTLDVMNCPRTTLKRGRPNTVQSGLRHPSPPVKKPTQEMTTPVGNKSDENINWINAEQFFESNKASPQKNVHSMKMPEELTTPRFVSTLTHEMKTPMLPPRLPFVRKTPATAAQKTSMLNKEKISASAIINKALLTPLQEQQSGRASIARLRSQNAGMVAAKAKLFGGMIATDMTNSDEIRRIARRESTRFPIIKHDELSNGPQLNHFKNKQRHKLTNNNSPRKSTPRRANQSKCSANGIQRRQKLRLGGKSPAKKSPLKLVKTDEIKQLITETYSPKIKNRLNTIDTTPIIKRPLIVNSPRRIMKTPTERSSSRRSPMRATPKLR